jgi:type IV fimbrial biogenesis protein FimT
MDILCADSQAPHTHCQSGFTLIELMVVVALLAILAMLAVPSWTQIQTRNAVRAAVNDFSTSLQFARSEAVRTNLPVTVCASSDGVSCTDTEMQNGWIVRTGAQDNAAGQVILQDVLPRTLVQMDVTNPLNRRFTFLPNGSPAANFAGATMAVCPEAPDLLDLTRTLVINRAGRVNVASPGACPI